MSLLYHTSRIFATVKGALREFLSLSFIHLLYKPPYRFLVPLRFRLHCEAFVLLARNFISENFDTRYLRSWSMVKMRPLFICHLIVFSEYPIISTTLLTVIASGYIASLFSSMRSNLFLSFCWGMNTRLFRLPRLRQSREILYYGRRIVFEWTPSCFRLYFASYTLIVTIYNLILRKSIVAWCHLIGDAGQ